MIMSSSWPNALPGTSSTHSSPQNHTSPDGYASGSISALSEYEELSLSLHPPTVEIDNSRDPEATLITVGSANRRGILLEVVQLLTDLDLTINKAQITSDGGWFVDVFHVKDHFNRKLVNTEIIEYIKQSLGASSSLHQREVQTCRGRSVTVSPATDYTSIELIVMDRPGLLSDISAMLTRLGCNVEGTKVWTHKKWAAFVLFVNDRQTGCPIHDENLLSTIKDSLTEISQSTGGKSETRIEIRNGFSQPERRLHQLLQENRDYEGLKENGKRRLEEWDRLKISISNCTNTRYAVVKVSCKDRPKLLFDTVCTLTDMQYVVFHATIESTDGLASQEYYVRHVDGGTLTSSEEQERLCKCLEAAIERRTPEGVRLELRTKDRVGLLSDVTRKFQETGLTVTMADVETNKDQVLNTFYVTNASGKPVDEQVVESLRRDIGYNDLTVRETPAVPIPSTQSVDKPSSSLVSMIRSHSERFLWGMGFGSPSDSISPSLIINSNARGPYGTSTRW